MYCARRSTKYSQVANLLSNILPTMDESEQLLVILDDYVSNMVEQVAQCYERHEAMAHFWTNSHPIRVNCSYQQSIFSIVSLRFRSHSQRKNDRAFQTISKRLFFLDEVDIPPFGALTKTASFLVRVGKSFEYRDSQTGHFMICLVHDCGTSHLVGNWFEVSRGSEAPLRITRTEVVEVWKERVTDLE